MEDQGCEQAYRESCKRDFARRIYEECDLEELRSERDFLND